MMAWPIVPLGEIVQPAKRWEAPLHGVRYRQLGVRLWGEGAYERESIDGSETKYAKLNRVVTGDLVVNKIWARSGSVAVVPDALGGAYVSGEFPTFAALTNKVDSRWLHWLTKTKPFWEQCEDRSRGTSGQNRIRPEQFLSVMVPVPPIEEQRRIVTKLARLSERLNSAMKVRTLVKSEASAVLPAFLNTLFGNPYRNLEGSLAIKRYEHVVDVSDDVADGPHITPQYVEKGVPFVTVLNITSGRVDFNGLKYITPEDHAQFQRRARVDNGDVLISKDGSIGIPCFVDTSREFSFFVSVALVKPKRDILDGKFLYWVLRSPYLQERIKERSRGDMICHLVLREIRDLLVPLPPINRQRDIIALIEKFHADLQPLIALQDTSAIEIASIMPSMLNHAFSGQL